MGRKFIKNTEKPRKSVSVYTAWTGKDNPLWADKIYNPDSVTPKRLAKEAQAAKTPMRTRPGGQPLTNLVTKAKQAGSWIREKTMDKLK